MTMGDNTTRETVAQLAVIAAVVVTGIHGAVGRTVAAVQTAAARIAAFALPLFQVISQPTVFQQRAIDAHFVLSSAIALVSGAPGCLRMRQPAIQRHAQAERQRTVVVAVM